MRGADSDRGCATNKMIDGILPEELSQRFLDAAIVGYSMRCMRQMIAQESFQALPPLNQAAGPLLKFVREWAEKVPPASGASMPIPDLVQARYKLGLKVKDNLLLSCACCHGLGLSEGQTSSLLQLSGLEQSPENLAEVRKLVAMLQAKDMADDLIDKAMNK